MIPTIPAFKKASNLFGVDIGLAPPVNPAIFIVHMIALLTKLFIIANNSFIKPNPVSWQKEKYKNKNNSNAKQ